MIHYEDDDDDDATKKKPWQSNCGTVVKSHYKTILILEMLKCGGKCAF